MYNAWCTGATVRLGRFGREGKRPNAGARCGESVVDQENLRQCVRSPGESPPRVSCIAMLQG